MRRKTALILFAVLSAALIAATLAHPQTTATAPNTTTVIIDNVTPQSTDTYAAKFICGMQRDQGATILYDAQPGSYSTKINVHNNTGTQVNFRKKIIWLLKPNAAGDITYKEQPTAP